MKIMGMTGYRRGTSYPEVVHSLMGMALCKQTGIIKPGANCLIWVSANSTRKRGDRAVFKKVEKTLELGVKSELRL